MITSSSGKRYGVITPDQRRSMSGLQFVQGLVTGTLPLNSMAATLNYDIEGQPAWPFAHTEDSRAHATP